MSEYSHTYRKTYRSRQMINKEADRHTDRDRLRIIQKEDTFFPGTPLSWVRQDLQVMKAPWGYLRRVWWCFCGCSESSLSPPGVDSWVVTRLHPKLSPKKLRWRVAPKLPQEVGGMCRLPLFQSLDWYTRQANRLEVENPEDDICWNPLEEALSLGRGAGGGYKMRLKWPYSEPSMWAFHSLDSKDYNGGHRTKWLECWLCWCCVESSEL